MARNRTPKTKITLTLNEFIGRMYHLCLIVFIFAQMRYQLVDKKLFLVISAMLLLIFCFDKWREIFFDQGSNRKRRFFIDNSFGTVREPHANNSYYDNSEIKLINSNCLNLHECIHVNENIRRCLFHISSCQQFLS